MAIARFPGLVIDCPDPAELAHFYGKLLDWSIDVDDDGSWANIHSRDKLQAISFQRVDDYRAPDWPGQAIPQQMHLDVIVDDLEAGEEATLALGASKHHEQPGTTFHVYLDPAGHPFCLCLS